MHNNVKLSGDGKHFVYTCEHCQQTRKEPVNPALNKIPFFYLTNCSSCGSPVDVDFDFIANVQASFLRASAPSLSIFKKNPTNSEESAGISEEMKLSPAINPADKGIALKAALIESPQVLVQTSARANDLADRHPNADKYRGVTDAE